MNRLALRGLFERRARTAFTLLAVVLGVALIAGTFVLTDTISRSFDQLVATSGENVDVRVVSRDAGAAFDDHITTMPAAVERQVRGVDGVAATAAAYTGAAVTVVDARGERVGPSNGAPTLLFSGGPARFDVFDYTGRAPRTAGEISISAKAADDAGVQIGDRVRVQGTGEARPYEVVGLMTFGGTRSVGGAAFTMLVLPEVQRLADAPGRITEVTAQAQDGVSQTELQRRVRAATGGDVVVRTGEEDQAKQSQELSAILQYLTLGLLACGLIALLVGCFVIFNTFTITVAQRTREFGMLRTIGASRRQVLQAVVLEALLIGVVGSALGLLVGIALAPALQGMLGLLGFEIQDTSLVVASRTVLVALALGTAATLLSSVAPALRATRIAPMEAMREGETRPPHRVRRRTLTLETGVVGVGLALMILGLFAGLDTGPALSLLGVGAVILLVGVGLLSPLLVGPLARLLGRPLAATGGVAARIASGNAVRAPGRTAGTAAALMVGVALVAFAAIFVNGFKASFSGAFEKAVTAEFVVFDPSALMPETVAAAASKLPGVAAAANLRHGTARSGGEDLDVAGLDPRTAPQVIQIEWDDGSDAVLRALGPADAVLETGWAKERSLGLGSTVVLQNAERRSVRLTVRGTFEDRGQLLGDVVMPEATLRERFGVRTVLATLVAVAGSAQPDDVRDELDGLLARDFPALEPQTRQEFIDSQVGQINQILYVFYALLALSVIIALFGIVNTLALSVFERTRELGLLRAVGATRRQIRQIVRGEAIITAVMGAGLGVAVGVVFGALVSRPLGDEGFVLAIPYVTMGVLLVLGALAGVVAAVIPARRASRVDVLEALTHQ